VVALARLIFYVRQVSLEPFELLHAGPPKYVKRAGAGLEQLHDVSGAQSVARENGHPVKPLGPLGGVSGQVVAEGSNEWTFVAERRHLDQERDEGSLDLRAEIETRDEGLTDVLVKGLGGDTAEPVTRDATARAEHDDGEQRFAAVLIGKVTREADEFCEFVVGVRREVLRSRYFPASNGHRGHRVMFGGEAPKMGLVVESTEGLLLDEGPDEVLGKHHVEFECVAVVVGPHREQQHRLQVRTYRNVVKARERHHRLLHELLDALPLGRFYESVGPLDGQVVLDECN